MARENHGEQKTTPQLDPNTGEVIRVSGQDAARITTDVLTTATLVLVEFSGLVSLGREVCDVFVTLPGSQAPVGLGSVLMARRAVLPGNAMGLTKD